MIKVNMFSKPIIILFHYQYLLSIPLSRYFYQYNVTQIYVVICILRN